MKFKLSLSLAKKAQSQQQEVGYDTFKTSDGKNFITSDGKTFQVKRSS